MGFILTFQAGIKIKLLDDSGTMRFILTFQVYKLLDDSGPMGFILSFQI